MCGFIRIASSYPSLQISFLCMCQGWAFPLTYKISPGCGIEKEQNEQCSCPFTVPYFYSIFCPLDCLSIDGKSNWKSVHLHHPYLIYLTDLTATINIKCLTWYTGRWCKWDVSWLAGRGPACVVSPVTTDSEVWVSWKELRNDCGWNVTNTPSQPGLVLHRQTCLWHFKRREERQLDVGMENDDSLSKWYLEKQMSCMQITQQVTFCSASTADITADSKWNCD